MLYIAYGSNMHLRSMAHRCPTANVVGCGVVKDYDLRFRGVATIEPSENGAVPVVVWDIGERDERALDAYEGWPHLYRKEITPVELDGQTVDAMVYIMNGGPTYREPDRHYYNIIREGYESAGFDVGYLENAVEQSRKLALEQRPEPTQGLDIQMNR